PGFRSPVFSLCDEVGVKIVTKTQVQGQLGGDTPVILNEKAKFIHSAGVYTRSQCRRHQAGLISEQGVETGVREVGNLGIAPRSGGAMIIAAEFQGVMSDVACVLFCNLEKRTAGVVYLPTRTTPSETGCE